MRDQVMSRREFLKKNIFLAAAIAVLGYPFRAFGEAFTRKKDNPNVSNKEARYYRTLAG